MKRMKINLIECDCLVNVKIVSTCRYIYIYAPSSSAHTPHMIVLCKSSFLPLIIIIIVIIIVLVFKKKDYYFAISTIRNLVSLEYVYFLSRKWSHTPYSCVSKRRQWPAYSQTAAATRVHQGEVVPPHALH